MQRYRCASCGKKADLKRLFDGRYLVSCKDCGILYISQNVLLSDEAYLEFLEKYDEGLIERNVDVEKMMEKEGIIRSKDQIIKMVEDYEIKYEDLPKVMKDILSSRYNYVRRVRNYPLPFTSWSVSIEYLYSCSYRTGKP